MIATINQESADSGMAATYFTGTEVDDLARLSGLVDVLVICRARFSHRLARLVARMRASGVPVLYDVDDLVFDPDYAPLLMETIGIPPMRNPTSSTGSPTAPASPLRCGSATPPSSPMPSSAVSCNVPPASATRSCPTF